LAGYLNIGIETIRKYNPDLTKPVIQGKRFIPQGYELRLPAKLVQQARLAAAIPETLYSGGVKNELFHQVKSGESVVVIAQEHGVELEELLWANKLDSSGVIYAGQNLRIPKPGSSPIHLTRAYKLLAKNLRRAAADS
jgi:membrane-bound lytic murein transglycosylase D